MEKVENQPVEGQTENSKPQNREKRERPQNGEKRERKEGREGGERRQKRDGEKRERNEKGEEKEGQKRERKPRESKFNWDKESVTLETVIPAIPKKKDQIAEPDQKARDKKLDDLQAQIQTLNDKKRHFIDDLIQKNREVKDQGHKGNQVLRDTLKDKQDNRKKIEDEFHAIKSQFEIKKAEINQMFEQTQDIRKKMKVCMGVQELKSEIELRQYSLNNEALNGQQEQKLIKEIENLKKAIPQAEKLAPLEEQMEVIRKEKNELGTKMNQLFPTLKSVRDEVNGLFDDLNSLRESNKDIKQSIEPIIQKKKDDINEQIQKIRDQMFNLKKEHREQLEKFRDEQELIRHIEWSKKIQDRLKRDQQRKEREERKQQLLKEDEDAEKEQELNKAKLAHYKDIALCEQLISFCKIELSKHSNTEAVKEEEKKEINLDSKDWKNEKVTIIKSKRDNAEEFMMGGGQNKQNKKKLQYKKKEVVVEQIKITLSLADFDSFASIKIVAPKVVSDLAKTIQILEEKKKYFEELPIPEKIEEPTTEEKQETEEQPKKTQKAAQIDNEEEYPEL